MNNVRGMAFLAMTAPTKACANLRQQPSGPRYRIHLPCSICTKGAKLITDFSLASVHEGTCVLLVEIQALVDSLR